MVCTRWCAGRVDICGDSCNGAMTITSNESAGEVQARQSAKVSMPRGGRRDPQAFLRRCLDPHEGVIQHGLWEGVELRHGLERMAQTHSRGVTRQLRQEYSKQSLHARTLFPHGRAGDARTAMAVEPPDDALGNDVVPPRGSPKENLWYGS